MVKVVPALAAGATVVHKPAELTPLTAFEFARAIADAGFPPGAFNLVPGSGAEIGAMLTRHPDIDHVSFTGSTPVGSRVAAAAAETIKRVTLELGGKSASVILADADDELLVRAVKITVANCYQRRADLYGSLPADRPGRPSGRRGAGRGRRRREVRAGGATRAADLGWASSPSARIRRRCSFLRCPQDR